MSRNNIEGKDEETKALIKRIKFLVDTFDSQAEFGRHTNMSRSTISAIYNGRIENLSFVVIKNIVDGTRCSVRWLISGNGSPFQQGDRSNQAVRASTKRVEEMLAIRSKGENQSGKEESLSKAHAEEMLEVVRDLIDSYLAKKI